MNDEIKEILVLQNYVNKYKSDEKSIINHSRLTTPLMLDYLEVKNLLDYITNLQEENEKLKELCDEYEEEHSNEFQCWKRDRKELLDKRERIQKAIEYIKEHNPSDIGICGNEIKYYYTLDEDSVDNLLNILQNGGDSQ